MLEQLIRIYVELTGNEDVAITPKTRIDEDLSLSSLGKVQLVCAVEDHFDIEIPNKALSKFKTVQDIVRYLEKNAG